MLQKLINVPWYTADPSHPYLIKASATTEKGYSILITDMEFTYLCEGDKIELNEQKKVILILPQK
jgi:hypothetical protein